MKALLEDYERITGATTPESIRVVSQNTFAQTASNIITLDLKEDEVPDSFFEALEDLNSGRVVGADRAHSEEPPFRLKD